MTTGRWLAAFAAVALAAVVFIATRPDAPDPAESTTTTTTALQAPTTEEAIVPDPSLGSLPGRLLITGENGEILTLRPDGTEPITIAEADGSIAERSLPAWSSSGESIAWGQRFEDERIEVVIASATGETLSRVEARFVPGYIAWDPTDRFIAISGDDGRANQVLEVIDVETGIRSFVAEGAPVYFEWLPDGTELLVHTAETLEFVTPDGSTRTPVEVDGDFRVPVQVDGSLVVGFGREVGHVLSVASPEGSVELELIRYATPMAFTAGNDGRIALLSKGSAENQQLSAEQDSDLQILEPNNLIVIELDSGDIEPLAEGRGVAWFFDRDGTRLAYITEETVGEMQRLQWHLWDGNRTIDLAVFSPSGRFGRDHLAFFDQFDRSTSLWAPDGAAFAYAGGTTVEDLGIWVQSVDEEAVRVARGVAVTWSPGS